MPTDFEGFYSGKTVKKILQCYAMYVYLLILILAVVQSLFGVGILLFGTPILLLSGYSYETALLYLLPASAALSWSQVWDYRQVRLGGGYRKLFFFICIPVLFLGMMLTSKLNLKFEIKIFVTIMLFVAFGLRSSGRLKSRMQEIMKRRLPFVLGILGMVQGLSNMGGSILTPLVSSLYRDKHQVLAGVSFDYAFMASFQLLVLIFIQKQEFHFYYLVGSMISLSVRYLIGKRIFTFTSERVYHRLINGFILVTAVILGLTLK